MSKTSLALVILAACSSPSAPPTSSATPPLPAAPQMHPMVASASTIGPTCGAPGVVADDGLDDVVALNAALASGCGCVQLGFGVYNFDIGARARNASHINTLNVGDHQCIRGVGPGTVLKFTGDAQTYDLVGVSMTGAGPLVEDLTIDTTGLSNVQEQTHAIQVAGPSTSPVIRGVTFVHAPAAGTSTGGDCIKLVGFAATSVSWPTGRKITNALITDDMFVRCPRSGVNVHSGVYGMVASDSQFIGVAKVDFDSEEVNGDSDQWALSGLTFINGAGSSEIAISIAAAPHVSISSTVVIGRGIYVASSPQFSMTGVVDIKTVGPSPQATVRVFRNSSDVAIAGSYLGRSSSAPAGPVFESTSDAVGAPSHVIVSGSRIVQGGTAVAMRAESTSDYTFAGNDITCAGCSVAVDVQGVTHRADRGMINGNRFAGATLAAVRLTGSNLGVGRTSVIGNMGDGSTQGMRCENATATTGVVGIAGPLVSNGNNWPANAVACVTTAGI